MQESLKFKKKHFEERTFVYPEALEWVMMIESSLYFIFIL